MSRPGTPALETDISPSNTFFADDGRPPSPPPAIEQVARLFAQLNSDDQTVLASQIVQDLPIVNASFIVHRARLPAEEYASIPGVLEAVRAGLVDVRCDPFAKLPPEVGFRVLEFVDHPRTLTRAAQVSRTWRRFASTPIVWRTLAHRFGFSLPPQASQPLPSMHDSSLSWLGLHPLSARDITPPPTFPPLLPNHHRHVGPVTTTTQTPSTSSAFVRRRSDADDSSAPRPRKRARRSAPTPATSTLMDIATMESDIAREVGNLLQSLQTRFLATGIVCPDENQLLPIFNSELGYLDRALSIRLHPPVNSQLGLSLLDLLEGIVRNESAHRRGLPLFGALRVFNSNSVRGLVGDPSIRAKLLDSFLYYGEQGPSSTNIFNTQSFQSTFPFAPRDEMGIPLPARFEGPDPAVVRTLGVTPNNALATPESAPPPRRCSPSDDYAVLEKGIYDGDQPSVSCLNSYGFIMDKIKPSSDSAGQGQTVTSVSKDLDTSHSSHPKEAFRLQYEVTRGWLDKGGRLLSRHYLYPEVMITDMVADDDRIVLGMGNNAIHVLDARTGLIQETLSAHTSGVWCLALVPAWPSLRPSGYADQELRETTPSKDLILTEYDPRAEAYLEPGESPNVASAQWENAPWFTALSSQERKLLHLYRRIEQSLLTHSTWTACNRATSPTPPASKQDSQDTKHAKTNANRGAKSEQSARSQSGRRSGKPYWKLHRKYVDATNPSREAQVPKLLRHDWTGVHSIIDTARETELAACRAARNTQGLPNAPPIIPESEVGPLALARANNALKLESELEDRPLLVSGGCDRTVIVWDLTTGKRVHVLRGHTATVRCISLLTIRGRVMALTGSRDNEARLWDLRSGLLIHTFRGHTNSIRCMAVREDCEVTASGPTVPLASGEKPPPPMFATASYDSSVRVWDAETGQCVHVLSGHSSQVYSIAFRRGTIITGSMDTTVRVWDAVNGRPLGILRGHTSLVSVVTIRGNMVVTGGSDGRILVWDLDTFSCIHRLCAHDNSVTAVQFVPGLARGLVDQHYLARRRASQPPRYERGTAGAGLKTLRPGSVDEHYWSYNPEDDDARWLVSASNDGSAKLWDLADGVCVRYLGPACKHLLKIVCTNDRAVMASFPILNTNMPPPRTERSRLDILSFRPLSDEAQKWVVVKAGPTDGQTGTSKVDTQVRDGYVLPRPGPRAPPTRATDVIHTHLSPYYRRALMGAQPSAARATGSARSMRAGRGDRRENADDDDEEEEEEDEDEEEEEEEEEEDGGVGAGVDNDDDDDDGIDEPTGAELD